MDLRQIFQAPEQFSSARPPFPQIQPAVFGWNYLESHYLECRLQGIPYEPLHREFVRHFCGHFLEL